jgi:hypothetical protein
LLLLSAPLAQGARAAHRRLALLYLQRAALSVGQLPAEQAQVAILIQPAAALAVVEQLQVAAVWLVCWAMVEMALTLICQVIAALLAAALELHQLHKHQAVALDLLALEC